MCRADVLKYIQCSHVKVNEMDERDRVFFSSEYKKMRGRVMGLPEHQREAIEKAVQAAGEAIAAVECCEV